LSTKRRQSAARGRLQAHVATARNGVRAYAEVTRRRRELRAGAQQLHRIRGSQNDVHLGAGRDVRAGWVNVDLWPEPPAVDGAIVVSHDLRTGLPVPAGSCRRIYSSHFFEHLPWDRGEAMLTQCLAALAPGGQFRMAVPDFNLLARKYIERDEEFFNTAMPRRGFPIHSRPGAESIIDWMNYGIYQDGEHVCMFDGEKAVRLLTAIGFRNARVSSFDPAWDVDVPVRRLLSLYVEAER
jgi:predicted SAM-dependent methyltransferase